MKEIGYINIDISRFLDFHGISGVVQGCVSADPEILEVLPQSAREVREPYRSGPTVGRPLGLKIGNKERGIESPLEC